MEGSDVGVTGKERKGFFQRTPDFPPAELLFRHFGQECHKGPKNLHNLEFVLRNSLNVKYKGHTGKTWNTNRQSDICTV